MDQAATLRQRVTIMAGGGPAGSAPPVPTMAGGGTVEAVFPAPIETPRRPVRVVAVTSGKGGVGKSNVSANLAVALAHMGRRVMVLDADLGLGNLDVLLGLTPACNMADVLQGRRKLAEALVIGPGGIIVLPAGSGFQELTAISDDQMQSLQGEMEEWEGKTDVLLIDTGAGIGRNVTFFATMAQEIVVVACPEPTSLTDAYALMKVLSTQHRERKFRLLVTMTRTPTEGREVYRKLSAVAGRFLDISIDYIGSIPWDARVPEAVCRQRALVELYPQSEAGQAFLRLASDMANWPAPDGPKGGLQFFWHSLLRKTPSPL